jgi:hypothetical protein
MLFQGDILDRVRHIIDIFEKPAFVAPHRNIDAPTDEAAPVSSGRL